MPRGCVADWDSYLLDEDEESAGPDRGTVKLARRPQVVGHKDEQEDVGAQCGDERIAVAPDWPTCDGGGHQGYGADKDEALVGRGIGTITEGEEDQGREDQNVRQRNDVEEFRIATRRAGIAGERISGGQNAEDHHETRPEKTCDTETAMDVHATGGDQGSLSDEQEDPAGEGGSVQVNDETGQRGAEDSGEIVGASKAQEDGGEQQQGHRREKEMVEAAAGHESGLLRGLDGAHCNCGHKPPAESFLLEDFWGPGGSRGHSMPSGR